MTAVQEPERGRHLCPICGLNGYHDSELHELARLIAGSAIVHRPPLYEQVRQRWRSLHDNPPTVDELARFRAELARL